MSHSTERSNVASLYDIRNVPWKMVSFTRNRLASLWFLDSGRLVIVQFLDLLRLDHLISLV